MSVVNLKISGKDYQVACDDGQEEDLRLLADDIDERVSALIFNMGSNPGEAMALLLTALTMADELVENKKEIESLARNVKRLSAQVSHEGGNGQDAVRLQDETRIQEMEAAMASTMEEIAARIEKIADQIEVR